MSATISRAVRVRTPAAALVAAVAASFVLASGARAETSVGGTVESTLALSLSEPTLFRRVGAGRKRSVYEASIPVEVTATDEPVRLSLADGEALSGRRHGHLVRGAVVLKIPLQAAAARGPYRSLDARVDPVLKEWREPVSLEGATIHLRQVVRSARPLPLSAYRKLLLVTITAAGP